MRGLGIRPLGLVALLALSGCGGESEQANTAATVESLRPGQYEVASEVTQFRRADQGAPRINTPVGTRSTAQICIGSDARVTPALFAMPNQTCTYSNYYIHNGLLNVQMDCTQSGLHGPISETVSGNFQDGSFDVTRELSTSLTTDGDVQISAHLTGHRTGSCTAPAAGAEGGHSSSAND